MGAVIARRERPDMRRGIDDSNRIASGRTAARLRCSPLSGGADPMPTLASSLSGSSRST